MRARALHGFTGTLDQLVSLGGDSDTLGSIAGQLMGACLGVESVPTQILERVENRAALTSAARRFSDVVRQPASGD